MKVLLLLMTSLFFFSCSNDRSAGVLTETESGKKISGQIIDASGLPVSGARISLYYTGQINARDSQAVREEYSDEHGFFQMVNIPDSLFTVFVENVNLDENTLKEFSACNSEENCNDTLMLAKSSKVSIALDEFGLKQGDTVGFSGTSIWKLVDSTHLNKGYIAFEKIPSEMLASLYVLFKENKPSNVVQLPFDFEPGSSNIINEAGLIQPVRKLSLHISDSLAKKIGIQLLVPTPIWLPNEITRPSILTDQGHIIKLDSIFARNDSTLFSGTIPILNFSKDSVIKFKVFSDQKITSTNTESIVRYWDHLENTTPDSMGILGAALYLNEASSPYITNIPETFVDSASVGVALWVNIDGPAQSSTYTRIFASQENLFGFAVQQRNDRNTIEVRLDTKNGASNEIYGTAPFLDGNWHHYAFTILGDQIKVVADGVLITDKTFTLGDGFTKSIFPWIGVESPFIGAVDELMLFQASVTPEWISLQYHLQNPAQNLWLLSD